MKVLVVGDWHSELHEEPVYQAFKDLGHSVLRFSWFEYFKSISFPNFIYNIYHRIQEKYMFGPIVLRVNRDLVKAVSQ